MLRLYLLQLIHELAQSLNVDDPDLLQHACAEPQLHACTNHHDQCEESRHYAPVDMHWDGLHMAT
jgi:hypothetical protein